MWTTSRSLFLTLCSIVVVTLGDTVFYTNSPRHLVTSENYTSYKLAVPGSNPITIIEATQGPPNEEDPASSPGSLNEMRRQNWIRDEEFLFRRKSDSSERNFGKDEDSDRSKSRTTVYSPDLLKKFLADYEDKVKKSGETEKKEKLQEILLFDDEDEENNMPLNSQPEEKYGHQDQWTQNKKYDTRRYERPNSGWVTMDVIPWSSSKVSKWQGHVQRLPNRPGSGHSDYDRPDYVSVESYDGDRFQNNYRPPNRPNYNEFDHVDRFSAGSSSHSHGQGHHHNKYHEKRPYYDYQTSSSSNINNYHHSTPSSSSSSSPGEKDIYRPWRGDIITDNRAPDFPDQHSSSSSYHSNKNRRPGASSYENYSGEYSRPYETHKNSRPTSSPESGNGEWILVSTTKGYHFPRNGQRAIAMKPHSFTTHKSVQLSVKDPKETAFSFDHQHHFSDWDQSGDHSTTIEHQLQADNRPAAVASSNAVQKKKKQSQQQSQKKVVKKVMPMKSPNGGVDSTAVLAAVGAGMVPATVAMLMPMIAGRRKRDLSGLQSSTRNVTHFPDPDYEETLPRILQQHVR